MADSRTTSDLVRKALGADRSEYSDDQLSFPIRAATALVDQEIAPYASDDDDLLMCETFIAAFKAVDDTETDAGTVESVSVGGLSVKRDTDDLSSESASFWKQAIRHDPTGRLVTSAAPTPTFSVSGGDDSRSLTESHR